MKCLRTFDSHNQLHTEGLFSRDLRGYKAVLALLGSHSALFSSEMAMNLACYIPAEPAASHTPSGHRREAMRVHEKKNILSPLAHFVFQHHLIKVFFLLEVASVRTAISSPAEYHPHPPQPRSLRHHYHWKTSQPLPCTPSPANPEAAVYSLSYNLWFVLSLFYFSEFQCLIIKSLYLVSSIEAANVLCVS